MTDNKTECQRMFGELGVRIIFSIAFFGLCYGVVLASCNTESSIEMRAKEAEDWEARKVILPKIIGKGFSLSGQLYTVVDQTPSRAAVCIDKDRHTLYLSPQVVLQLMEVKP
jgi:hypothetical protein